MNFISYSLPAPYLIWCWYDSVGKNTRVKKKNDVRINRIINQGLVPALRKIQCDMILPFILLIAGNCVWHLWFSECTHRDSHWILTFYERVTVLVFQIEKLALRSCDLTRSIQLASSWDSISALQLPSQLSIVLLPHSVHLGCVSFDTAQRYMINWVCAYTKSEGLTYFVE